MTLHGKTRTLLTLVGAALGIAVAAPQQVAAQLLSGEVGIESRAFSSDALHPGQERHDASLVLAPELYFELGSGGVVFEPFARIDVSDDQRTHFDLRSLSWEGAAGNWEFKLGIGRVFWGVTESQHLVDIVNQSDFVENPDGEDKLGQPMVNVGRVTDYGVFELFVLPGFRERTFAGVGGRLRPGLVVDADGVGYESEDESNHIDLAARWSHFVGAFDLGISWFRGTSRDPRFVPLMGATGPTGLTQYYDLMEQFGLDVQWTSDAWLWKLEGITRDTDFGGRYWALTAGFEYTLYQILGSDADLGIVVEYLGDDRGDAATTAFEDDIFVGGRIAANDVTGSQLLFGGIVDRGNGATFLNLEGSRRLSNNWTVEVQTRAFLGFGDADLFYELRQDHHLLLAFRRFF